jgi:hypothetical protein
MASAILPVIVCVVGALVWALSSNGKVQEMGRIAFFCGLFWLVHMFSGRQLHF